MRVARGGHCTAAAVLAMRLVSHPPTAPPPCCAQVRRQQSEQRAAVLDSLASRQLSMEQVPLFRRSGGLGQRDTKRQRMDRAALRKKFGLAEEEGEEGGEGGEGDDEAAVGVGKPTRGTVGSDSSDSGSGTDSESDGYGGPRGGPTAPRGAPVPLAQALKQLGEEKDRALELQRARAARPAPLAPEQLARLAASGGGGGGGSGATAATGPAAPARVAALCDDGSSDSDVHAVPLRPAAPPPKSSVPLTATTGLRTTASPYVVRVNRHYKVVESRAKLPVCQMEQEVRGATATYPPPHTHTHTHTQRGAGRESVFSLSRSL
jgi:hypothetical protein